MWGKSKSSSSKGFAISGSSPRMWGKFLNPQMARVIPRFIPTHVGEILTLRSTLLSMTVHPHACGGNQCTAKVPVFECGSSPRMWGKCAGISTAQAVFRFIPTHVGEMQSLPPDRPRSSVHPHACGGNCFQLPTKRSASGSSPRMWGKFVLDFLIVGVFRFIPTHVGEIPLVKEWADMVLGSSPRMWGKCCREVLSIASIRFIPTHVGEIIMYCASSTTMTVHPHACGGNLLIIGFCSFVIGSSPRMWGK